jgi:hypothetical protein
MWPPAGAVFRHSSQFVGRALCGRWRKGDGESPSYWDEETNFHIHPISRTGSLFALLTPRSPFRSPESHSPSSAVLRPPRSQRPGAIYSLLSSNRFLRPYSPLKCCSPFPFPLLRGPRSLLPIACCLLPVFCSLFSFACSLLPVAYHYSVTSCRGRPARA